MDELIENMNFDEMDYYYHITSKGYGNEIISGGLYMKEKELYTTTIKITEDIIENMEEYCKSEYKTGIIKRQEMVIIGVPKGEEEYLVGKAELPYFTDNEYYRYLISNENILGYIDLETLDITYNPEYIDFNYRR